MIIVSSMQHSFKVKYRIIINNVWSISFLRNDKGALYQCSRISNNVDKFLVTHRSSTELDSFPAYLFGLSITLVFRWRLATQPAQILRFCCFRTPVSRAAHRTAVDCRVGRQPPKALHGFCLYHHWYDYTDRQRPYHAFCRLPSRASDVVKSPTALSVQASPDGPGLGAGRAPAARVRAIRAPGLSESRSILGCGPARAPRHSPPPGCAGRSEASIRATRRAARMRAPLRS